MKKLLLAIVISIASISVSDSNIKAEQPTDCCSDCCRWSELFGDCMGTGTGSYCLDVKYGTYCDACIVVTPDTDK